VPEVFRAAIIIAVLKNYLRLIIKNYLLLLVFALLLQYWERDFSLTAGTLVGNFNLPFCNDRPKEVGIPVETCRSFNFV